MKCRLGGPEGPFGRFGGGVNFLPLSSGIEPRMFDHATPNKVCDIWRIVAVVTCQRGTVAFTQIIIRQEKRRGYVRVRIVGLYGCGYCCNAKFLCCERNYFYSGLDLRACNLFGSAVIARYVGCGRYRCTGQPCTEIDIDFKFGKFNSIASCMAECYCGLSFHVATVLEVFCFMYDSSGTVGTANFLVGKTAGAWR